MDMVGAVRQPCREAQVRLGRDPALAEAALGATLATTTAAENMDLRGPVFRRELAREAATVVFSLVLAARPGRRRGWRR